jgi:hypothetical protein
MVLQEPKESTGETKSLLQTEEPGKIRGGGKMKTFEKLKEMSIEEVSHILCELQYEASECSNCPHKDKCFPYGEKTHNGFYNWLNADIR